ncbi:hypothetical protein B5M09_000555 [Aphanomyces astaci]|uniref:Aminotransferase class I/classII large domain-containing protein n=1 Tax=Aphanomyces astaci TaxID=112090 RepID=A0A425DJN2_APHAT|nr:hypothetical protein B5M09_000555 [Aphanomyces astaci]
MSNNLTIRLAKEVADIEAAGTFKKERVITSAQGPTITVAAQSVLNFCANNYLGLSNHPEVVQAAKATLDSHGFGLSSVRFICGTQDIHKELERTISSFHSTDDTILFPSCFDANAGLFEALLNNEDAVISDELNHASIIDGIRLCKAERHRFKHMDLTDLEEKLKATQHCRTRLIATDGAFSMDGDIINSTLGKALGGGTGGYTTGRQAVVDILRQRARPYLFSNSVAPAVVGASLKVFELLTRTSEYVDTIRRNTHRFRDAMTKAGFTLTGQRDHPIVAVMVGDARLASTLADNMLKHGIYVIGFSFPVVPKGKARIRVQISAAHTTEDVDRCVEAFVAGGKALNILS